MSIMGSDQSKHAGIDPAAVATSEEAGTESPLSSDGAYLAASKEQPALESQSIVPINEEHGDEKAPLEEATDAAAIASSSLHDASAKETTSAGSSASTVTEMKSKALEPAPVVSTADASAVMDDATGSGETSESIAAVKSTDEAQLYTTTAPASSADRVVSVIAEKEAADLGTQEDDFVPPDMEHIVATGASDDKAESMASLRDAVRKAREAAGAPREALPPGFEDDNLEAEVDVIPDARDGKAASREKNEVDDDEEADDLQDAVRKAKEASGMVPSTADDGAMAKEEGSSSSNSDDSSDSDDSDDSDDDDSDDSDDSDDDDAPEAGMSLGLDGDDDDDEGGGGGSGEAPKTKNEVTAPEVQLPAIEVLPDADLAKIRPLGTVHSIVDSVVVVAQDVSKKEVAGKKPTYSSPYDSTGRMGEADEDEYSVLDAGSLLCFEDGKVLGLVFETFGSVHAPLYSIRYPSASAIDRQVVQAGRAVSYLPNASTYVLTRVLKAMKGSDASNIYDEEVGEDEIDYSDDEAEAEAKRRRKESKRQRQEANGSERGNKRQKGKQQQQQQHAPQQARQGSQQHDNGLPARQDLGPSFQPRTALPPKPRAFAALPARPNFDADAPAPSAVGTGGSMGGRMMLSYDDAGAGGDVGSSAMAARPVPARGQPSAGARTGGFGNNAAAAGRSAPRGIAGLPPKPASLPQSPVSTATSPALPQGSSSFTPTASPSMAGGSLGRFESPSAASSALPSAGAAQHYPRSYTSPAQAQGSFSPPPAVGSGGHYNPHFAGYWTQPQQTHQPQAPWAPQQQAPTPTTASTGAYGGYGAYPAAPMYPPSHYPPQHYAAPPSAPSGAPAAQPTSAGQQAGAALAAATGAAHAAPPHPQQGSGPLYYGGYTQAAYSGGPAAGAYGAYGSAAYPVYGAPGYGQPAAAGGMVDGDATAAAGSYDPKRPRYPGQASPSAYPQPPQ